MAGTTLAAVVRIVDLPVGTTITGAELLEVIQTASGVGQSVQVSLANAVAPLGVLPTGGGTSQILAKSSPTNFSTAWYDLTTFVSVNATTLATTGSGTALVIGIAAGGVGSTQLAANAVQRTNITAFAIGSAQVDTSAIQRSNITAFAIGSGQIDTAAIGSAQIGNNSVGTNQLASSLGIASSLSIGTLLTVGGTATVTGTTILNGGLQVTGTTLVTGTFGQVGTSLMTGQFNVVGTTLFTSNLFGISGTTIVTGTFGQTGTSLMTGTFGVVGTATFTGIHGVVGTTLFTSGAFGVSGTTLFTSGAFGVVGTATFTSTFGVVGTSLQTGVMNVVGTTNLSGVIILPALTSGFLQVSGTGVISTSASPGAIVLLNTLTPNNIASSTDTTSLTGTYKSYLMTFENVCPATQTTTFQMTVATSGSNFISGGYISMSTINVNATIVSGDNSTSVLLLSGLRSTTQLQTALSYGLSGSIRYFNPASTISRKQMIGEVSYVAPGGINTANICQAIINGWYDGTTSPVTGVAFAFSSGNIQTGTIKIYGLT